MIADRSRAVVPDLDRFIKGKSRRDRKELIVVPSVRGQLAEVLQEELQ